MVERRLGRGLEFFLSGTESPSGDSVQLLEISRLSPSPNQPRRDFDPEELASLARSIRTTGILQPLLVRRTGDRFEIVAGERRWRAAKEAGLERVPALVRDVTDELAAVLSLVENLQRADLNAIEKAKALRRIQGLTKVSQDELAHQIGVERPTVANFLRLLDLPEEVQEYVSRGTLSMGHARALLALTSADEQKTVAEGIIRQRLTVRQVESLVQELNSPVAATKKQGSSGTRRPGWLVEIENTLSESLDARVTVRYATKHSRITIECGSREHFERMYERLKSLAP